MRNRNFKPKSKAHKKSHNSQTFISQFQVAHLVLLTFTFLSFTFLNLRAPESLNKGLGVEVELGSSDCQPVISFPVQYFSSKASLTYKL